MGWAFKQKVWNGEPACAYGPGSRGAGASGPAGLTSRLVFGRGGGGWEEGRARHWVLAQAGSGSAPDLVRSPSCSGEVTGTPQLSPHMAPPSSNGLVPGAGWGRTLWGGSRCHLTRDPMLDDTGRPSSPSEDTLQELVSPRVASTARPAWQMEQVNPPQNNSCCPHSLCSRTSSWIFLGRPKGPSSSPSGAAGRCEGPAWAVARARAPRREHRWGSSLRPTPQPQHLDNSTKQRKHLFLGVVQG